VETLERRQRFPDGSVWHWQEREEVARAHDPHALIRLQALQLLIPGHEKISRSGDCDREYDIVFRVCGDTTNFGSNEGENSVLAERINCCCAFGGRDSRHEERSGEDLLHFFDDCLRSDEPE
jgi:hypothetical protein